MIILWDHRRICGPSLTEASLCGAWLYWHRHLSDYRNTLKHAHFPDLWYRPAPEAGDFVELLLLYTWFLKTVWCNCTRGSSVGTVIILRARRVGVWIPAGARHFFSVSKASKQFRGLLHWRCVDWGVNLTTHLGLGSMLRKTGAVPPFPLTYLRETVQGQSFSLWL
jgi:hypothetical protein